jgi:hypothetical protein
MAMFNHDDMLTQNEQYHYLTAGMLPDDFDERLRGAAALALELDDTPCSNCDGVRDMNIVLRDWWEENPNWCPFCCDENGKSAVERYQYYLRLNNAQSS